MNILHTNKPLLFLTRAIALLTLVVPHIGKAFGLTWPVSVNDLLPVLGLIWLAIGDGLFALEHRAEKLLQRRIAEGLQKDWQHVAGAPLTGLSVVAKDEN